MSIPTLICGDRVAFGVIRHGTVKHAYKPLVSVPGDYNVLVAWDDGALLSHRASTLEKEDAQRRPGWPLPELRQGDDRSTVRGAERLARPHLAVVATGRGER